MESSNRKLSPQSWDDEDDQLLIRLKEVNNLGWKQISKHFNNRTSNACQFRWRRLKSGQLKKHVKHSKKSSKKSISKPLPSASLAHSSSNGNIINNNKWTFEEDGLIRSRILKKLSLTELSILLPNKTTDLIINRINFLERQKLSIASLLTDDSDSESENNLHLTSRTSSFSSNMSVSSSDSTKMDYNKQNNYTTNPIILPPLNGSQTFPKYLSNYKFEKTFLYPTSPIFKNSSNRLPPLSKVYSIINQ